MRERIFKALVSRYTGQMEDSLLKIDLLMAGDRNPVIVDHIDITGAIDKELAKVAEADEKLAKLRRFYGSN
tara:strand:+ start:355 stop:567 length:213 start_codon:yes stop_codon:yes gene_type:complete